ncbi:MAG: LLM class flavin-dependent oxidoreductase [Actinobacteria bacterium]|nr:LLM class flavin-dependent oxidoreductase [Actinomycetota bacterium]
MSGPALGMTLPQFTGDPQRLIDTALRAEDMGLDSIWVFDHLWPLGGQRERPILEGWTALSYLAAATSRIRLGTLVTRSSLRHPAVVAKMIATVGEIAPGRIVCGMGSGDEGSRDENEAFGIPYYTDERRTSQLASTVAVVAALLRGERVSHEDDFARLANFPVSPRPERRPALWVGGNSEEARTLAARVADGWNGWGGSAGTFAKRVAAVRKASAGRDLEISWAGLVMLDETDEAARARMGKRDPSGYLVGGPETVAAALAERVAVGAMHLIATFPNAHEPHVLELLATRVRSLLGS